MMYCSFPMLRKVRSETRPGFLVRFASEVAPRRHFSTFGLTAEGEESEEDEEGDGGVKVIEAEPIPDEVNALIGARTAYYDRNFINTEEQSRRPKNIYDLGGPPP